MTFCKAINIGMIKHIKTIGCEAKWDVTQGAELPKGRVKERPAGL